jgi:hypothetical protein
MSATLPPTEDQISAIVSDYVDEARRDYVGLWQISIRVRRDFNTKSEAENKKTALKIVDKMLQNGLEAVTLASSRPGAFDGKTKKPPRFFRAYQMSGIASVGRRAWAKLFGSTTLTPTSVIN